MFLQCRDFDTDGLYAVLYICEVLDAREEGLAVIWQEEEKRLDGFSPALMEVLV